LIDLNHIVYCSPDGAIILSGGLRAPVASDLYFVSTRKTALKEMQNVMKA